MNDQEQGKLNQEVTQSNKAKEILENTLFQESFNKLKNLYSTSLLNTGSNEGETREKLWLAYQVLNKVEQHFKEILETGKLASKQMEDFRSQIKNKKF